MTAKLTAMQQMQANSQRIAQLRNEITELDSTMKRWGEKKDNAAKALHDAKVNFEMLPSAENQNALDKAHEQFQQAQDSYKQTCYEYPEKIQIKKQVIAMIEQKAGELQQQAKREELNKALNEFNELVKIYRKNYEPKLKEIESFCNRLFEYTRKIKSIDRLVGANKEPNKILYPLYSVSEEIGPYTLSYLQYLEPSATKEDLPVRKEDLEKLTHNYKPTLTQAFYSIENLFSLFNTIQQRVNNSDMDFSDSAVQLS